MDRRALGEYGEAAAGRYLESVGCDILGRRWRIKGGEIDLIAMERGEVVFVEVKTRSGEPGSVAGPGFGDPEEAVTAAKRRRLRLAAYAWLDCQPVRHERFRIDVIAIIADPAGGRARLRHLKYAVGEDD